MKKADFSDYINSVIGDWGRVVEGALLEVDCKTVEDVPIEKRHVVVSFIDRRMPEDNFSIYRSSFAEGYGFLEKESFEQKDYGVIKEKFGYEERG